MLDADPGSIFMFLPKMSPFSQQHILEESGSWLKNLCVIFFRPDHRQRQRLHLTGVPGENSPAVSRCGTQPEHSRVQTPGWPCSSHSWLLLWVPLFLGLFIWSTGWKSSPGASGKASLLSGGGRHSSLLWLSVQGSREESEGLSRERSKWRKASLLLSFWLVLAQSAAPTPESVLSPAQPSWRR